VIGELYEHALAGWARPEIEHADGSRKPLPVDGWLHESPGDKSILDRCEGPTLDIGSGPGRLTVALSERGIPALGIDITPYAVDLARSSGALVMLRDVFGRVPGTGRWTTALLADGNIGIGGDPATRRSRAAPSSRSSRQARRCAASRSGCAMAVRPAPGSPGPTSAPTISPTWPTMPGSARSRSGRWTDGGSRPSVAARFAPNERPSRCYRMLTARPADDHSAWIDGTLRNMNGKIRVAGIGLALSVMAGLVLLIVRPSLDPARIRPLPLIIGAWLAFLVAAWLLRKVPRRTAVVLILLGGIALQTVAVSVPRAFSTDLYRYMWDGRVQAAGIDPYQYVPAATQLTGLRNDFLFYPKAEYCVSPSYVSSHPAAELTAGCTRINRPTVPTIYPPVAEAYFLAVYYLHPADDSSMPIQAATAAAAVLVTVLLLIGLGRIGRDVRMAALWAWCPTVVIEAGNSAHVDVLAVGITAAAMLVLATARTTRRTVAGGILLGLAIATKLTPVLTVPALLRRRWVTVAVSAASAFIVVYLPHMLIVGAKVIGFLPGYLQQENYTSGTRYGIIGLFITGPLASAVAVLVLAAIALAVLQFSDPDRPWQGALYMTAGALAVTTPHYQWYSLLLVMLVALDGRPEWLAFAAGGYYAAYPALGARYYIPWRLHDAIAYGVPLVVVGAGWLIRHELARRAPVVAEPVVAEPVVAVAEAAPAEAPLAGPVLAEAGAEPAGREVPV